MPLSFNAFVKQVLYCLNKDSHSSADEFPRRYFSEYHFKKQVSYFSLTSLHSGASDADIVVCFRYCERRKAPSRWKDEGRQSMRVWHQSQLGKAPCLGLPSGHYEIDSIGQNEALSMITGG